MMMEEAHDAGEIIPYHIGMALKHNEIYLDKGKTYLCTHDTCRPIYSDLDDIVNIFVEVCSNDMGGSPATKE